MMENIYDEYIVLKTENERLLEKIASLELYIKALEANTSKSVLRRLYIQLDRNKLEE